MESLVQDVKYALRSLRKAPTVTALVVGSLALAIAGNTAVFSLVNGLLFRPLPYDHPERLALVGEYQDPKLAGQVSGTSAANFLDWRERQTSFSAMAAYSSAPVKLGAGSGSGDRSEPVTAAQVTPEFFPLLGVQPRLGRAFLAEEGKPGAAAKVVLLTYGFWQSRFAGDPGVLGKTLVLNGEAQTVVGVLPERFEFLDPDVKLYRPLALDPATAKRDRRDLLAMGRLAPGVTTAEAATALRSLGERLATEYPEANRGYTVQVLNLRTELPSHQDRQILGLLQGALIFVLLIACANIANLLLARTQGRVTELAVRSSLGAGRWRIARQLATESLVSAAVGGVLGMGLGYLATRSIANAFASRLPKVYLPAVDGRVLGFTVGVTVVAGLIVGLLPTIQVSRMKVQTALKEGGRGASLGGRRRLVARGLVVAEIALSLILLGGGAVMVRSFLELQHSDPGFETAHLATLRVDLPDDAQASPGKRAAEIEEMSRRLATVPGVVAASTSSFRPRTPLLPSETYTVDASPPPEGQAPPSAAVGRVDPRFFETLGIAVRAGRAFTSTDRIDSAPVAVVNRALVERQWPDADPLGRQITVEGKSHRIVGVVDTVKHGIIFTGEDEPVIYLPLAQQPPTAVAVTLRSAGDPDALAGPVRQALTDFNPDLVVSQVQSIAAYSAQFFVGMKVITSILGGFGTLALLLAALGTYGVLAFTVAQRTHEIGVRMALGARAGQVRGMVTRQGLLLAAIGIVLGVPGVILVTRAVGSALSGITQVEPLTVLGVGAVLAVVTVLASWMPARRAAAVDPAIALRDS